MGILTRRRLATALFGVVLASSGGAGAAAQRTLEYEVKAAFLANFLKFVVWPRPVLGPPAEPFRVCVFGADPFGAVLDRTLRGGDVDGHLIVAERVRDEADLTRCRVLFVPQADNGRAARLIRTARPGLLTVGESGTFLRDGGNINFVIEGEHVRFDINLDTAAANGLTVSSKLIRVARVAMQGPQRSGR
jgi:hypothetical protein